MSSLRSAEEISSLSPEFLAVDIHQKLLNASIALLVIATVVYSIFVVSRASCAERNGWEIWILYPISYLTTIILCVICILFVRFGGAGRHVAYWSLNDPGTIVNFLKIQTATEFTYLVGVTLPKVCIMMMYLNIFIEPRIRIITQILLGIIIINFVATVIVTFTICQPFSFKWDKNISNGHCADLMAAYRYISIPNILIDLGIIFIPLPSLHRLQINRIRKIGLIVTFLTGGLGIITAVLRFVGFYTVNLESDPTYLGVDTQIYTALEPSAYFICSCLPGIRPAVRQLCHSPAATRIISKCHRGLSSFSKESEQSKYNNDIPLVPGKGDSKASVTAMKRPYSQSVDHDNAGFIRLEETTVVTFSPTRSSGGIPE